MDRINDVSTEENILVFNVPDEALERALPTARRGR
jgi:hypothetical protein